MPDSASTSLWRPGNALAALGLLIMRGFARLPMRWLQGIGKAVGTLAWLVYPYRRRVGLVNLRICFPDLPEAERVRLLRRHYQSIGMGFFELAAAWYKPEAEIPALGEIKGLENAAAVQASGRGALLLTGHFTSMEITGRLLLTKLGFSSLSRPLNQPVFAKAMIDQRSSRMRHVIHMNNIQEFIRLLRAGEFIFYTPDQGKRIKYSAILPFFGEPAITNTATGRIAQMGRAAILPYLGYRRPDGTYCVEILPEVKGIPSGDPEADAIGINHILEDLIRAAPDQYFWLHKRFKARGPGYPDVYAKSPSQSIAQT